MSPRIPADLPGAPTQLTHHATISSSDIALRIPLEFYRACCFWISSDRFFRIPKLPLVFWKIDTLRPANLFTFVNRDMLGKSLEFFFNPAEKIPWFLKYKIYNFDQTLKFRNWTFILFISQNSWLKESCRISHIFLGRETVKLNYICAAARWRARGPVDLMRRRSGNNRRRIGRDALLRSRANARYGPVNHPPRSVTESTRVPRRVMQKRPLVRVISRYAGHLLYHSSTLLFRLGLRSHGLGSHPS